MELFRLFGSVFLKDEASKGLDDINSKAENTSSKFGKVAGGIASGAKVMGAAMGTAALAAGAAAISLGKTVVAQFGELEQNLGGSEAVFGQYAEQVQKIGEDAYKNMGVSQSQYLATANKMGALFQGNGVSQKESMDMATAAMQRAADMASVMGIDMQVALDSVAGAAKGNFTMMDNLGVAMNDTSINAYLFEKTVREIANGEGMAEEETKALAAALQATAESGDFSTKIYTDMGYSAKEAAEKMDFLKTQVKENTTQNISMAEKSTIAMEMFMGKTEQYAGNFAKESTQTVTGSLGLLQAAMSSFTAGLGNANADMGNLANNLVDAFQSVVDNVIPILENLLSALPKAVKPLLSAVGKLLPKLLPIVTNLFEQVLQTILELLPELIPAAVEALMTIVNALIDNLPLLVDAAIELVTALINGITMALPTLIPAAVAAITQIVTALIENLPLLLDAALQLILGLAQGLLAAIPQLVAALPPIITGIINFIISAIPQIIDAGIQLLMALIGALPQIIDAIVAALPQIINGIVNGLLDALPQLIEAGIKLFVAMIGALPQIIVTVVGAIPQIIAGIVEAIIGSVPQLVSAGGDLLKGLWQGISDAGTWLWDKISGFFGGIVDKIKQFFGIASPSKLFESFGINLDKGFAGGIDKAVGLVEDASGRLGEAALAGTDIEPTINMAQAQTANANAGSNGVVEHHLTGTLDITTTQDEGLARKVYRFVINELQNEFMLQGAR